MIFDDVFNEEVPPKLKTRGKTIFIYQINNFSINGNAN